MTSPSLRLRSLASCGLIHADGSHVILVSGLGSSWSQPLLAKRPSQIVGSGRKMISSPPCAAADGGAGAAAADGVAADGGAAGVGAAGAVNGVAGPPSAIAVPPMNPSCRARRQNVSASLNG